MAVSPAASHAAGPRAGTEYRIGRYRVRARLGKGGMGVVYLGRDQALDRDVAVKTLRVDGSQDDESRGRFEIEAKAAARLQHPNIVTVFELGEDRGLPFIAMELLGGQDLETLLRSGEKLSTAERLDIVIQTLRGLDFAHAHHIVHRDIKPSNIRVLDDGGAKILDFGIAKVESTSVTRAGMMVGTPYYMSPEHIRGGVLDGRTDVFAVGVILHELFARKRPFAGEDPTRVLYRIVNEPHPRLGADVAGPLTPDVQAVIDKALEKDADDRYNSAALMADALSRVRERCPAPLLDPKDAAVLSQARKHLSTHQGEPALLQTVETIARAHPDSTEAQRLVRLLRRRPNDPQAGPETASFPELDATFSKAASQADETVISGRTVSGRAETLMKGERPPAPSAAPAPLHSNAVLYGAIGVVVLAIGVAGITYLTRSSEPQLTRPSAVEPRRPEIPNASTETTATPMAPGPRPDTPAPTKTAAGDVARTMIEIKSQPAGARVRINRKILGTTPLRTEVATNSRFSVTLSLDGYQSREVRVNVPIPPTIEATLTPDGPPASLVVESGYPVTVSVSGRVLATEKPGVKATLPAGDHEVLIEAPSLFLKHRESVKLAAGGTVTIRAPATGKLGVRASPDNCRIFINGVFVDFPPILDRAIAAGNHVVSFEWPDGTRSEEKIQVQPGRPSYVMGRKP